MKKITIGVSILALLVTAKNTFAQEESMARNSVSGLYFGVKGTPQLSWMYNSDDANMKGYETMSKFGANFGAGAGYNFTDNLGMALDVLYSVQGKKYKVSGAEYNQKMDYLKIPVMFTYTTRPAVISFVGKIGPQIGILTRSEGEVVNGSTTTIDTKDRFENVNFSAVVSAGARYFISDYLFLDVAGRFDYAFTDAEDKDNKTYSSGRASTYNMTAGVEVGINYLLQ